jgi:zinc transporter ZupT
MELGTLLFLFFGRYRIVIDSRLIMSSALIQLLLFGLMAGLANVLGGLILFPSTLRQTYKSVLRYLLALGAGFMLAVTFIEILPKTVTLWQSSQHGDADELYIPMLLVLLGYLLTQFFEHTIAPHFHLGEEVHSTHPLSRSAAYTAVGGLLIHTFFDGVSIAAASQIDARVGALVFIAVFLHKFPEGFTIGSMMIAAGKGMREVIIATSLIGLMTLFGVMLFYVVGGRFESTIAYAFPISAGVTLYVAASDLIPEVNHHGGKSPLVSLSVFAGVAIFFVTHYILSSLIGH